MNIKTGENLGIDFIFKLGNNILKTMTLSLITFSTTKFCYVFDLLAIKNQDELIKQMVSIFEDEAIKKVGFGFKKNLELIEKEFKLSKKIVYSFLLCAIYNFNRNWTTAWIWLEEWRISLILSRGSMCLGWRRSAKYCLVNHYPSMNNVQIGDSDH